MRETTSETQQPRVKRKSTRGASHSAPSASPSVATSSATTAHSSPNQSNPTTENVSVAERGIDAEHFNLWDWTANSSNSSEQPAPAIRVKRRVVPKAGAVSVSQPAADESGVAWTADTVLAACNSLKWPEWVKGFRDGQLIATAEVLTQLASGKPVVFLDAPVGTGKTLIGEMVRRLMDKRGLYVCSGLQLQDQFAGDFEYGAVLKGRGNYATERMPYPEYTTADCVAEPGDPRSCLYCSTTGNCSYQIAKKRAFASELAVLNTTFLLYEANNGPGGTGRFSGRELGVLDEGDLVEDELMRFVEFRISEKMLRDCGIEPLKKGVHKATVKRWMVEELVPGLTAARDLAKTEWTEESRKKAKRLEALLGDAMRVAETVEDENWIRDYEQEKRPPFNDTDAFIMRPVMVDKDAKKVLWRHCDQWLVMSGTIISGEQMARDLGLVDGEWGLVRLDSEFPVENRPVVVKGVANMTAKTEVEERPKLAKAIQAVVEIHEGENILVHTHSYKLTKWLYDTLRCSLDPSSRKRLFMYESARSRDSTLDQFKREGGVLLAPSLDRGVDLPDDLCRVMVVAKSPFPYLGDKQISTRIHLPGGNTWFAVQTVRTIVQMTGRGVRHKEDWAVTYILDSQFSGNVYKKNKSLFPKYFQEGVNYGVNSTYAHELRKKLG